MAKKEIRTKYIKSLMAEKDNLAKILEESTKESLDAILEENVNRTVRQMLAESDDNSFEEEEVNADEPVLDTKTEENDSDDTVSQESGEDTDDKDVWSEVEDCKDEDGEYDLRGKDINTVLKVLQSMEPTDGVRIVKNDDGTATVEPENDEEEFVIDIEDGESEPNEFETEIDSDSENLDDDDEETMEDIDIDSINFADDSEDADVEDDDEVEFEFTDEDEDDDLVNEGQVNLGYTDNYQKKTAMTMPHDNGDGDSRFDTGAPRGDGKRWVGHKGANGGNPYTQTAKQTVSEDTNECNAQNCIYEVEFETESPVEETHTRGMVRKHNSVGRVELPDTNVQREEEDTRNVFIGGKQIRNTSRNTNESRQLRSITRQANAILAENEELKDVAKQIKKQLKEATIINTSLAKVIKLVTENSTTRDEKINILKRFDKVKSLNESRALYTQISNELKNAHSVNNNVLNNTLTEVKGQDKNMIVETKLLDTSDELSQILDLQKRLMNL